MVCSAKACWSAALVAVVLGGTGCGLPQGPAAGAGVPRPAEMVGPDAPQASTTADAVTVTTGGHQVSASLADGTLHLVTPFGRMDCTASILHEGGWTKPAASVVAPATRQSRNGARAEVVYPVPGERELHLELAAWRGLPAVFVTSRLVRRGATGAEYYYWNTDLSPERYTTQTGEGPREIALKREAWDAIVPRDWLWFPTGPQGGLAVLQANTSGRAPGESGSFFLQALPRSLLMEAGEAHQARFAVAGTATAAEAATLAAAIHAHPDADVSAAAVACQEPRVAFGPVAPEWLRQAEVYNLYYRPAAQWTDAIVQERLRHVPFIIGSTPDRAALEKCHAAGVRLLHYVTYTCLLDTELQVREGGQVYSEWSESIDCESRDLKDHPDWVCIDAAGRIQKDAWGQEFKHPGLLNTCLHQPGLHEAAIRQVRLLMEMGFDGVFIDLAGPTPECHGPAFARHVHAEPAKTNTGKWEGLQAAIYREVKRHGADRVVMQNTCTGTLASHWPTCDMQMLEAFPFGSGSGDLRASSAELEWTGLRLGPAVEHGKRPVILPYLSDVPAERLRDAALLSYAYARIQGFLWADAFALMDRSEAKELALALYQLRLGEPRGPVECEGPVRYRRFQKGIAVLNASPDPVEVSLRAPRGGLLADLGYTGTVVPDRGVVRLTLAPQSGRVLVAERSAH
jgi:hypothetical protein